ncbi:hypothetical protein Hamer_G011898 [Homarus americanus]|uniref:Uncharacterized protein n=1 Tax=Homarus americanus TaxID=6706 RepID=A0A8J5JX47_HOMAM|nr:hypothetical protein Hamer_G011898 [Homarus americanus]
MTRMLVVVLVFLVAISHATELHEQKTEVNKRLFLDGLNTIFSIGDPVVVMVGMMTLFVVTVAAIIAIIYRDRDTTSSFTGYYSPSASYASRPIYTRNAYTAHRFLEEGANKFN